MSREEAEHAFAAHVMGLVASLESLDYYALLNLQPGASMDDVKRAYYKAAGIYHPDGHRNLSPQVRESLLAVFRRMSEAYRVLSDHERRARYDGQRAQGQVRMVETKREANVPKSPEATLKTPAGKRCLRQALDALKRNDLKGARLNLQLAMNHEGADNQLLQEKLREVEEKISAAKAPK